MVKAVGNLCVVFDDRIFSLPTVQKAALKFTDNFSFSFELGEHSIKVIVRPVSDTFDASSSNVVQLERNLILAHAFSNTKLIAA